MIIPWPVTADDASDVFNVSVLTYYICFTVKANYRIDKFTKHLHIYFSYGVVFYQNIVRGVL